MVRGALEGGKLSGRYFHKAPEFAPDDIRKSRYDAAEAQRYAVYEPLLPPGVSMTAFALRYLLDFPTTHTIVMGGATLDQYREAAGACGLPPLSAETHARLREIRESFAAQAPRKSLFKRLGRWVRKCF